MIGFHELRQTRPSLWLAFYALAMLCVFSFIAFEVLDLDGSDFQTDSRRASVKPAEGEHYDVRRASLAPLNVAIVTLVPVADDRPVHDTRLTMASSRPLPPRACRLVRGLFARASLDVPPAA